MSGLKFKCLPERSTRGTVQLINDIHYFVETEQTATNISSLYLCLVNIFNKLTQINIDYKTTIQINYHINVLSHGF